MGQIEGSVVIVTGGASGIGRASAVLFAQQGSRVVIADVDLCGAQETQAVITGFGGQARVVPTDVSQSAATARLIEEALST